MAHLILFEHVNFHGAHKHVFQTEDLKASDDNFFDDKVSSFVILEGSWQFFRDKNHTEVSRYGGTLGPGRYPNMGVLSPDANDNISSVKLISG